MRSISVRRVVMSCAAALSVFSVSCARSPGGTAGGVRLVVNLAFNGPVNDSYQYFFLMRNAADETGQNGPIPVVVPPYLNGFATGSNTASAAFTDFVEYSRVQRQATSSGYALYHLPGGISGDPNRNIFLGRGEPDLASAPAGGNQLRFELDISRLQPEPSEPDPNAGARPRYIQINVVATTTTPINPATIDPDKVVDAFGEQRIGSGSFNLFLTIDAAQIGRVYQSVTNAGDPNYEPEHDSYPDDRDPAIDLVAWSVQITGR